jgi:hypothetical protein
MTRDYNETYKLMKRTRLLSNRINMRMVDNMISRKNLSSLDMQLNLSKKVASLYTRLYRQYEATKPEFQRD